MVSDGRDGGGGGGSGMARRCQLRLETVVLFFQCVDLLEEKSNGGIS